MSVRVVLAAEGVAADMSMPDALVELARRVADRKPVVVTIIFELPDGKVEVSSLPPSIQVSGAMVTAAHAQLYPGANADD